MSKKMKKKKPADLKEVIDLGKTGSILLVPIVGAPRGFPEVDVIPLWLPEFDPSAYVLVEENPIYTLKMVLWRRELRGGCKFFKVHLLFCYRRRGTMLWSEFDRDVVPPKVGAKEYMTACKKTIDAAGHDNLARLYALMAGRVDLFLELPGKLEDNILN